MLDGATPPVEAADLTFRPVPKRGGDRIVDGDLLQFIKCTVVRCEWPEGCRRVVRLDNLASHHIYGRGMGGGKRNDHPFFVAILCHAHHNTGVPCAHDAEHWNRSFQAALQRHVKKTRKPDEWTAIWAYMHEKGHPLPAFLG